MIGVMRYADEERQLDFVNILFVHKWRHFITMSILATRV